MDSAKAKKNFEFNHIYHIKFILFPGFSQTKIQNSLISSNEGFLCFDYVYGSFWIEKILSFEAKVLDIR
jgi:hypothetical protein